MSEGAVQEAVIRVLGAADGPRLGGSIDLGYSHTDGMSATT